ncbi:MULTISPECIES: sulfurtransferase [unclassified Photobacterium]|uniref:sulfurtransferase n=1 Tax=unclassified Photobacterium TaxID=2628852 RepID=UPI000D16D83F|nr:MULTISPECIES: rhodanese-like domain-containing protein [unclassified Photobacterium]PSV27015.1 sulfurtransferase [Photobacterium sp. GB-56]PSV35796.1 sulfurtransferase [Photobacterium sp. GB-27]PSV54242.1 sulfurtransferase [Photobacterium sp. GB-1]PSV56581.1 sulfurtransferase [Photobacterium sp. GB-3]
MSTSVPHQDLVSVQWLHQALANNAQNNLVVLDATSFMPGVDRSPEQELIEQRIPRARFFDFNNKLADPDTDLPHMLPSAEQFSLEVSKLGISNNTHVVIYDSLGMFSAPRGWWMFKTMGHNNVSVLDGGLPAWIEAGLELESGELESIIPMDFNAQLQSEWVIDAKHLNELLTDKNVAVIDARPRARFLGSVKEPREGIRSGHMPNAKNLPFGELLDNGHFIALAEIKAKFDVLSTPEQRLIFSCGSGVTACILALAANLIGRKALTVYDGSWTEWGATECYPVVK